MPRIEKKIVIANFYPVWPVQGGGQRRIFFLARELAKSFDVEIIVPERSGTSRTLVFSPHLKEIRVAVGTNFRDMEHQVDRQVEMAADLAYTLHWKLCPEYQRVLSVCLDGASAAVSAHPYSTYALFDAMGDNPVPFVFDSQNVEYFQKQKVLGNHPDYLEEIRKIEKTALERAAVSIACSHDDAANFSKLYGVDANKIEIIENGVDALGVPELTTDERKFFRNKLKLNSRLVAIFAGSFHHPNFKAADRVMEFANKLPNVTFLMLGSICNYSSLVDCDLPNVVMLGEVDESTKWLAFHIADVGLNPMETGSGTNIKIFEYAAAGLTIVSTPFGARGVKFDPEKEFLTVEVEDFVTAISGLATGKREALRTMGKLARENVVKHADWTVIGRKYQKIFKELIR